MAATDDPGSGASPPRPTLPPPGFVPSSPPPPLRGAPPMPPMPPRPAAPPAASHQGYPPPPPGGPPAQLPAVGMGPYPPAGSGHAARIAIIVGLLLGVVVAGSCAALLVTISHTRSGVTATGYTPPFLPTSPYTPAPYSAPYSAPSDSPSATDSPAPSGDSGAQQAQAVDNLLVQSAGARSATVAAVGDAGNCGNLAGDAAALQQAAGLRQALLAQVNALRTDALGNDSWVAPLQAALSASAESDTSYRLWVQTMMSSGCPAANDRNYAAAQSSDAQATAAKQQFIAAWNPVATGFGVAAHTQADL